MLISLFTRVPAHAAEGCVLARSFARGATIVSIFSSRDVGVQLPCFFACEGRLGAIGFLLVLERTGPSGGAGFFLYKASLSSELMGKSFA